VKKADGNFALEIEALPEAEKFSSPEELTAAIMKGYEMVIRRHPEQYLWLYPRWRYIPSNASEEYRKRFPFYARIRNYEAPDEIIKS
jgi:lauroyl/myristoyl acyltransferase